MSEIRPIMTVEQLEAYGFKEYPINKSDTHDRNWQYSVRDERGIKFFVTIRLWAFSKYSNSYRVEHDSFDAYCQYDLNGPKTFRVETSVSNMTPQQVIEWFEMVHQKLNCTYYEEKEEPEIISSCVKCGRYLGVECAEPYLCSACEYEKETGFRKRR